MTAIWRLRASSSSRAASASRRRMASTVPSGASLGLDRAPPGCRPRRGAIRMRLRAVELRGRRGRGSGGRRGRRRPPRGGRSTSSTKTASGSTSPATPSPPSTSWQKPCVVAIVAASKSASARARRSRRCGDLLVASPARAARRPRRGRRVARQRAVERLLGADQPLAHALAQLAGGHAREGHEQQLLERRALGDVARGQGRDRERLAGAGARLEHGDACGQRAADVERPDVGRARSPLEDRLVCEQRRPTGAGRSGRSASSRSSSQPSPCSSCARRLGGQLVEAEDAAAARAGARGRRPPWGSSRPTPTPCARPSRRRRRRTRLRRRPPTTCRRAGAARACRGRRGRRASRAARAPAPRGRRVGRASGGIRAMVIVAPSGAPTAPARSWPPRTAARGAPRSARASRTQAARRWRGVDARVGDGPQHVAADAGDRARSACARRAARP